MVLKKPKIVIIGAGMAGLCAANKLYTSAARDVLDLVVVEGGDRIGGRIRTSEFSGDRIEMGATWIHGICGSPVHEIASLAGSLQPDQPYECMDGFSDDPVTVAEDGHVINAKIVDPITGLFNKLMDFAQGKIGKEDDSGLGLRFDEGSGKQRVGLGSFLRKGLESYWEFKGEERAEEENFYGNLDLRSLEEAIFAMHENVQRTYTAANDLYSLDYDAEREYRMFPGEEITIAKGYSSVIESLASVLPPGLIQLGQKVSKIEWQNREKSGTEDGHGSTCPVKLHFCNGTTMSADHVIITVSLGVLKAGICENSGLFSPPLPDFKAQAISRLGYGVVNKLFLQLKERGDFERFPFLQLVFRGSNSKEKDQKAPWWMRRTASLTPIYAKSRVLLSWFAGDEATHLESIQDEEILRGVSSTISNFLLNWKRPENSGSICNGNGEVAGSNYGGELKFGKILRTKWGSDPLFLGSYSYVAVGSSGEDMDSLAEPLPETSALGSLDSSSSSSSSSSTSSAPPPPPPPPLQVLFAGEATHRTHYSTTHGAYFSGLREAIRLLQHYHFVSS